MKPKLVKGSDLSDKARRDVLDSFIYRYHAIGKGKQYPTTNEWINDHAFYIRKDGCLAQIPKHCEPVFLADL